MSDKKHTTFAHSRTDSAIGFDRPNTAPGPLNSFSAQQFADYEKRMSQDGIAKPEGLYIPRRPDHHDLIRPVSMPVYSADVFKSTDFAAYEKRLSATASEKIPDVETGMINESGITLELSNAVTLPDKRQSPFVRNARHRVLSVYRRMATLIIIANLVALAAFVASAGSVLNIAADDLATATAVNIFFSIAVRQEFIVNSLYAACLSAPLSAPLCVRRILAKIYENGGFHSGTAYAGTAWYVLLCATLTRMHLHHQLVFNTAATLTVAYCTLAIIVVILVCSLPYVRMRSHNTFEFTHRFCGWAAIAFLWALLILVVENKRIATNMTFGAAIVEQPTFWYLIAITVMLISPWVFLRKVRFTAENLSKHAVRLNYHEKLAPFRGVAIAKSPLGQYHSFATFPNPGSVEPNGQSIIVSKAGDWTASQVGDESTDRHYWLRGIPKTGVLGMCLIFRRVVIVTTGSGIGPCLAFLNLPENLRRPCRVIWSSPRPADIYGKDICESVKTCDPDALIWDTRERGRPDMVQLTYDMFRESGAEAVFVISNPKLTRMLVYAMESRGIPAFGPIWDS
ncbi:hypothetical protein SLS56_010438 [Neofusicoccum ribis]|uniref:Nonribosomal peptide synthetase 12 n=1 Tax=Neofusicoccum ribis TaxID=45134 RepID=A0ABR3SEE3_9PEZI